MLKIAVNIYFLLLLTGISNLNIAFLLVHLNILLCRCINVPQTFILFKNTTRSVLLSKLINGIIPWDSNGTKLLPEKILVSPTFLPKIYYLFTFFVIISVAHIRITRKWIVFCVFK